MPGRGYQTHDKKLLSSATWFNQGQVWLTVKETIWYLKSML